MKQRKTLTESEVKRILKGEEEKVDPETQKLIEQLQNEEKEELTRRQKSSVRKEELLCPICFTGYEEENVMPLQGCDHIFHTDCLQDYLDTKI